MKTGQETGDYDMNADGLIVFTEQYHLQRGYCCGCACKYCPYAHINVIHDKKNKK